MTKDQRTTFTFRRYAGAAAAGLALIVVACSEISAPTPPAAPPLRSLSGALASATAAKSNIPNSFLVQGLLRVKPLDNPVVVTKVIPSGGGSIDVPCTDTELVSRP